MMRGRLGSYFVGNGRSAPEGAEQYISSRQAEPPDTDNCFVTITGFGNYYGRAPYAIGSLIRCSKEPENPYDKEAIQCTLPAIGTVGYIANSVKTVAEGTMSAGRLYDRMGPRFHVRVWFMTASKIICKVETGSFNELERELWAQREDSWADPLEDR